VNGSTAKAVSSLWPGITWGDNALCGCTWGYLDGARQVKAWYAACVVHWRGSHAVDPPEAGTAA
jgi:hypothetical protein